MSRPRFLADHDFDDRIVRGLTVREPSVDIIRAREVGLQRTKDEKVLEFAAADGRVVISHDVSTMTPAAIHRINAGQLMPGLILIPQHARIGPAIDELMLVWFVLESHELLNDLRYISA